MIKHDQNNMKFKMPSAIIVVNKNVLGGNIENCYLMKEPTHWPYANETSDTSFSKKRVTMCPNSVPIVLISLAARAFFRLAVSFWKYLKTKLTIPSKSPENELTFLPMLMR